MRPCRTSRAAGLASTLAVIPAERPENWLRTANELFPLGEDGEKPVRRDRGPFLPVWRGMDGCPAVPRCHEGHKGVGIYPFVDG